jgi:hypothetical protein
LAIIFFSRTFYPFAQVGSGYRRVSSKDIIDSTGEDKFGYQKSCFCGEQAKRDGDVTLSIDRRNIARIPCL